MKSIRKENEERKKENEREKVTSADKVIFTLFIDHFVIRINSFIYVIDIF